MTTTDPTDDQRPTLGLAVNNPPKFYGLALALVCVTVLLAIGRVDSGAGLGVIGTIVGYCAGNGIAARRGEPVEPAVSARPKAKD